MSGIIALQEKPFYPKGRTAALGGSGAAEGGGATLPKKTSPHLP
jgi:hypothetical protein